MLKKLWILIPVMLIMLCSPLAHADTENNDTISIQPRTGGVWFQYSEQGHRVTYKTTEGYVANQPASGYSFTYGGNVNIDSSASPASISISGPYGIVSFSATLGSVTDGVTGVSVYFPPNVRGRVYVVKTYKVTHYKQMKRMFGKGEWKFDQYASRPELVSENYYIR